MHPNQGGVTGTAAAVLLYRDVSGDMWDIASVTPAANAEISTRGVLTATSSRPHFNILSALICSPRLTRYVPLSLLTLSHNSPKSSASHLHNPNPNPTPLTSPPPPPSLLRALYLQLTGRGPSGTIMHHFVARPWPPFYLLIGSSLSRRPTAALS